jgi:hypothetical protein
MPYILKTILNKCRKKNVVCKSECWNINCTSAIVFICQLGRKKKRLKKEEDKSKRSEELHNNLA